MKYTLDANAAKSAGLAARITENGKYIGKITRAEGKTSTQGSEGIELSFETDEGLKADYVSIWTHNRDGKELGGFKVVNALMTVLRLREIESVNGKVTESDGKVRDAIVFPQLLKPVGMVMQREEYTKRDGGTGYEMRLVIPFDVATGMTAKEILDRASTAEQVDKAVALLQTRKARTRTTGGGNGGVGADGQPGDPGPGIPDDDIPFADPYKGRRCYVV